MLIKDLSRNEELNRAELAAVRGGSNLAMIGGASQVVGGGFSFGSPVTQVAPQNVTQTETNVSIANVLASAGTMIGQWKLS